jgi:HD superfamily phosphodiesterase
VVLCAAYLHDIGIHEAERKQDNVADGDHESEGPPIAREMLTRLGTREGIINEVCDIIGHHHHPGDDETLNFKIVYDADVLVNLEEQQKDGKMGRETLTDIIEKRMLTDTGKQLARRTLLEP